MRSNIDVLVKADIADATAKFAVMQAQTRAVTSELNGLAKQTLAAGAPNDELKAKLYSASQQMVASKAKLADLRAEMSAAVMRAEFFEGGGSAGQCRHCQPKPRQSRGRSLCGDSSAMRRTALRRGESRKGRPSPALLGKVNEMARLKVRIFGEGVTP